MKRSSAILILACLSLFACRTNDESAPAGPSGGYPTDVEIMAKAYNVSYTVPEGLLVDERVGTSGGYTIYHVKDDSMSFELCGDSYAEAFVWESADNEHRAVNGEHVDSYENDRYFEFTRELSYPDGIGNIPELTSPGFSRIFKCSYLNRDGVDRNLRDGYAGTLHVRPLSIGAVRELAEYLWQFTFFWPVQKTVLSTYSAERAGAYEHTMTLAFVTNQGNDRCDLVQLVDWTFAANRNSGEVTKNFRLIRHFEAEFINGEPRLCVS